MNIGNIFCQSDIIYIFYRSAIVYIYCQFGIVCEKKFEITRLKKFAVSLAPIPR